MENETLAGRDGKDTIYGLSGDDGLSGGTSADEEDEVSSDCEYLYRS